jgi:hypothetical protein
VLPPIVPRPSSVFASPKGQGQISCGLIGFTAGLAIPVGNVRASNTCRVFQPKLKDILSVRATRSRYLTSKTLGDTVIASPPAAAFVPFRGNRWTCPLTEARSKRLFCSTLRLSQSLDSFLLVQILKLCFTLQPRAGFHSRSRISPFV